MAHRRTDLWRPCLALWVLRTGVGGGQDVPRVAGALCVSLESIIGEDGGGGFGDKVSAQGITVPQSSIEPTWPIQHGCGSDVDGVPAVVFGDLAGLHADGVPGIEGESQVVLLLAGIDGRQEGLQGNDSSVPSVL